MHVLPLQGAQDLDAEPSRCTCTAAHPDARTPGHPHTQTPPRPHTPAPACPHTRTPAHPDARTPEYYRKRPCGELVRSAAEILAAMLSEPGRPPADA